MYDVDVKQQTLYSSVRSAKNMIMGIGVLTHTYTNYFKNKDRFKKFNVMHEKLQGVSVGFIDVDDNKIFNPVQAVEPDFNSFSIISSHVIKKVEVVEDTLNSESIIK